jgi:RING finger/CHY zinc finger protein 1
MCEHYEGIHCEILAPCCKEYHACRICHDVRVQTHSIDRYAIQEVRCTACGEGPQPRSNGCTGCGIEFASYFCEKCNLWSPRPVYHCEGCRICYLLAPDERRHCDLCNLCYVGTEGEHSCPKAMVDVGEECCVCLETLYYGVKTPYRTRCGHWMHTQCMKELLHTGNFRCPLCKKTTIDMDWEKYGEYVKELQENLSIPLGQQHQQETECTFLCNDCLTTTTMTMTTTMMMMTIYRCERCGGYNTSSV